MCFASNCFTLFEGTCTGNNDIMRNGTILYSKINQKRNLNFLCRKLCYQFYLLELPKYQIIIITKCRSLVRSYQIPFIEFLWFSSCTGMITLLSLIFLDFLLITHLMYVCCEFASILLRRLSFTTVDFPTLSVYRWISSTKVLYNHWQPFP